MKKVNFSFINYTCRISSQSNTVPDQSLSVKEIIDRFTRGQSLPSFFSGSDDPQELDDDNMMQQEVLDDFERRQLAIAFEENPNILEPEKPEQAETGEAISQQPVKAPEVREISSDSSNQ